MRNFPSIKKNSDFQLVYRQGKSFGNPYLVMYIRKNSLEHNRIGISASKKLGNSVIRHRLIRLIREIFREYDPLLHKSFDLVVIVRKESVGALYRKLKNAFLHLCKLHGLIE